MILAHPSFLCSKLSSWSLGLGFLKADLISKDGDEKGSEYLCYILCHQLSLPFQWWVHAAVECRSMYL